MAVRIIDLQISSVQFYLLKHWKEVILCLILDIRYLKRLPAEIPGERLLYLSALEIVPGVIHIKKCD